MTRHRGALGVASALAVLAGLLSPWSIAAASAATDPNTVWTPPNTPLTNVASVPARTVATPAVTKPKHPVPGPWAGPAVTTAVASGTATVTVPTTAVKTSTSAGAAASGSESASGTSGTGARAGSLPVWLAPPSTTTPAQAKNAKAKAAAIPAAAGAVQVSVADGTHTAAAGSHGVLVSLRPSAAAAGGRVQVGVDLSSLSSRYGADVALRSRLVELPACSLTTPEVKGCLAQTPVASHYDVATGRLVADVTLPTVATTQGISTPTARSAAVSASSVMVLASTTTSAGGAGTYAATSLQNSAKWAAGSSSGGFSYSYAITTPPPLAGAAPQVSLAYDSSSVDGRTSSQNSQSSEIGDGWSLAAGGFIERSYQSCDKDGITGSGDQCWGGYNATMSLAGHSSQLVRDDTSNPTNDPAKPTSYHLQNDDGTTITFQGGASNTAWNGESVTVTDTTGMTYYFGTDHLPGDTGSPNSNSAWTVPVYSPNSGDPCYDSTKGAASWCQMAWRWNLDAVVDPHGNLTTYSYTPETNTYTRGGGQNSGTGTLANYTSGGVLHTINYGQTLAAQVAANGAAKSAAQITFTPDTAGRCSTDGGYTCTNATLGTANASHWPDVPYDQHCATTGTCTIYGPTFWSNQKITTISTQVLSAGAYTDVDSYALAQSFQKPGDGTDPTLWLDSITHTGKDGGTLAEPPATFVPVMMPNRVDGTNLVPAPPEFDRPRIQQIVTETGETINVDYNLPDCSRVNNRMPASPDSDTMACYSVRWYPPGTAVGADPAQDWFNHYTVASVTENDSVTDSPQRITAYTYGPAAWHRNEAENIDPKTRTWDDFRGFAWVTQVTGAATDSTGPQSQTSIHYLQGMDGDLNADGSVKHVQVADSLGESVTDNDWLSGSVLETDTYAQAGATTPTSYTVTREINPYTTVTHKRTGASDLVARYTATTTQSTIKSLKADGSWRTGTSTTTSDALNRNRTISQEAVADGLPEQCTYTSYATGGPGDLPDQTLTLFGLASCDAAHPATATAANLVSAKRTLYDNQAFGTAGAVGDATGVQSADHFDTSGNLVYATTATSGYDTMGRLDSATDPNATDSVHPNGATTTTTFSSANAGELPNKISTVSAVPGNSSTWTATKTLDPARGLTLTSTDQNSKTTTASYDALGRITAVWQPGRTTSQPPSTLYSYTNAHVKDPAKTGDVAVPATVTTENLRVDNGTTASSTYLGSTQIMNGFGEVRQVQANSTVSISADRLISDTIYDSHGRAYQTNTPWYNTDSGPNGTLTSASAAALLPSMTRLSYDGMGRKLTSSFYSLGQLQSVTNTSYRGADETDVTPPTGGTATTTITDAVGRTSQLWQYRTATATGSKADADVTSYTYTPSGQPAIRTDATGKNTWSYSYDLYGRQTKAVDPDTGTTTTSYNADGQVASTTDARGQVLAYTYDLLGRETGEYKGSVAAANQLAGWTYDSTTITNGLGQPASSTRYVGGATGDAYTNTVRGYNTNYQPTGSTTVVPGKLLGQAAGTTYSYATVNYYDVVTGLQTGVHLPSAGGSPGETVTNNYDIFGKLGSQVGASTYDLQTTYDYYGRPTRTTLNPWSKEVVATYNYDEATSRVLDTYLDYQQATKGAVDQNDYTYSPAGQLTSITNIPNNTPASTDRQCFSYDYLGRLSTAWTDTGTTTVAPAPSIGGIGGCTNTTPTSGAAAGKTTVGGPAAYWTSYTYDSTGNRTSQTQHNTTGDTTKDTTTTQTFPAAGQANTPTTATNTGGGTGGPHALLGTSAKTGTATPVTSAYQYDASGNTTAITTGSSSTSMTWDAEGRLASDKPAGATNATTYLYDPAGNLLARTTGTTTTLFLGPDELIYNGTAVSGTRYYSEPNGLTIVRQGTTETFQSTDAHGTATVAIDANTGTQTRRYLDPFGNPRGIAPTTWAGDKGFVGGTADPTTGLTNLGAREYQPTTGRFLDVDPNFNAANPQSWNGYAYSNNDPTNLSDPSGKCPRDVCNDVGGDGNPNPAYPVRAPKPKPSPKIQTAVVQVYHVSPHVYIVASTPHAVDLANAYQKLLKTRGPLSSPGNIQQGDPELGYWAEICAEHQDWCGPGLTQQFDALSQLALEKPKLRAKDIVISSATLIVFRALNSTETPGEPLMRPNGNPDMPAWVHVVSNSEDDPWISTTKEPSIAFTNYQGPNGVVAIALNAVDSEVVDAHDHLPVPDPMYDFAKDAAYRDREVLIKSLVPGEAQVMHWPGGTEYNETTQAQIENLRAALESGEGLGLEP